MQGWRLGFLGIETIPSWLGEFEAKQFVRFSPAEIAAVKTRLLNMHLAMAAYVPATHLIRRCA